MEEIAAASYFHNPSTRRLPAYQLTNTQRTLINWKKYDPTAKQNGAIQFSSDTALTAHLDTLILGMKGKLVAEENEEKRRKKTLAEAIAKVQLAQTKLDNIADSISSDFAAAAGELANQTRYSSADEFMRHLGHPEITAADLPPISLTTTLITDALSALNPATLEPEHKKYSSTNLKTRQELLVSMRMNLSGPQKEDYRTAYIHDFKQLVANQAAIEELEQYEDAKADKAPRKVHEDETMLMDQIRGVESDANSEDNFAPDPSADAAMRSATRKVTRGIATTKSVSFPTKASKKEKAKKLKDRKQFNLHSSDDTSDTSDSGENH